MRRRVDRRKKEPVAKWEEKLVERREMGNQIEEIHQCWNCEMQSTVSARNLE